MNSPDPQFVAPPETGANVLRGDVAIVGMGCLFAGSPDLDIWTGAISSRNSMLSVIPRRTNGSQSVDDSESKSNDPACIASGADSSGRLQPSGLWISA